ncbi:type III restriction endonuclease subunit R [Candidatus Saccharibacteria bacterium HGW-Saccharibacteria-1]|jgi:type III restriction enzyme|nr:MAG: type III restriction endonuclease subunit R [Candidatus Saccharibacteria bacterium HGW-Saccharibacteria-1]
MSDRIANQIRQRLSLRSPQEDALNILVDLSKKLELKNNVNIQTELKKVVELYPICTDFERDFVSICFALATGVGKTRLMGAFISYLYLSKGVRNFFVLAPNMTIYKKLIEDLGNPAYPKYVFKGIAEFAINTPRIITGENYNQTVLKKTKFNAGVGRIQNTASFFEEPINIHIFNIQKISAEVKGGKDPKVKRLSEYLGESYFEYLSGLTDLVVLMDESHHYRADRGMTVINELKPIFGLELTATPQVESAGKSIKFKNVVYEYSLRNAMDDGYVKEPFVATRSNFDPKQYTAEEIDTIKLEDGLRIHEQTKSALEVFARNNGREIIKPFVLVVAKDTVHAAQIRSTIESGSFFDGYYRNKVIEIHSNQRGDEKDDNIEKLLSLESPSNTIEIVVHVNMLKEGWDVTNLYTIIPLRASASATLTEQTIGRGLRLPYGQRVHDADVDRLTIVSHDKYQAIIEEANKPDSLVRRGNIITIDDIPEMDQPKIVVSSTSSAFEDFTGVRKQIEGIVDPKERAEQSDHILVNEAVQDAIISMASEHIHAGNLNNPEVRQKIVEQVRSRVDNGKQSELFANENMTLIIENAISDKIDKIQKNIIEIPRLTVVPSDESIVSIGDFNLDTTNLNFRPQSNDIYLQSLEHTNAERQIVSNSVINNKEEVIENAIISQLLNVEFIDYDANAKLLYKLCGQATDNFRSYLQNEEDVINVVYTQKGRIADVISAQIGDHLIKLPVRYDLTQTLPFTEIYSHAYEQIKGDQTYHYMETITPTNSIPQKIFVGFKKACHDKYKFDSKSEKDFATLLEKDSSGFVIKWLRPSARQFNITWGKFGQKYEPDFIVETPDSIIMVEVKKSIDVNSVEVQEKAKAAKLYCNQVSRYTSKAGGKKWEYVILPHDQISLSSNIQDLILRNFESENNV